MEIEKHYLRPGELLVTCEPAQITTILGSCVSVTLFHLASGAAGICHGILPFGESNSTEPGKYMTTAVLSMITRMARMGIPTHSLQAKVFGGAALFTDSGSREVVGTQNVRISMDLLEKHRIPVLARNVGGANGRKIVFHTTTGDVYLKMLGREHRETQLSCAV